MTNENKLIDTSQLSVEDVAMITIGMFKKYSYVPEMDRIDLNTRDKLLFKPHFEENKSKRIALTKEELDINLRFYRSTLDVDISRKERMTFKDLNPQYLTNFFQDFYKDENYSFKSKYTIQTFISADLKDICEPLNFYKNNRQLVHELWWLSINEDSYKFRREFSIKPLSEIIKYIPIVENIKVPDKNLVKDFIDEFQKNILDIDGIQRKRMSITLRPVSTIVNYGDPEIMLGGLTMFKNSNLFPFKYIHHGGLELIVSVLDELKRTDKYFILLQREVLKRMC